MNSILVGGTHTCSGCYKLIKNGQPCPHCSKRKEIKIEDLTREEKSLLLFFETCCVDDASKVDTRRMNDKDFQIAKKFSEEKLITFKRIKFEFLKNNKTHVVTLSDNAWELVHKLRKERAEKNYKHHNIQGITTGE